MNYTRTCFAIESNALQASIDKPPVSSEDWGSATKQVEKVVSDPLDGSGPCGMYGEMWLPTTRIISAHAQESKSRTWRRFPSQSTAAQRWEFLIQYMARAYEISLFARMAWSCLIS